MKNLDLCLPTWYHDNLPSSSHDNLPSSSHDSLPSSSQETTPISVNCELKLEEEGSLLINYG